MGILDLFLIVGLSLMTYLQIREHRVRDFILRIRFSEYMRAKEKHKAGQLTMFNIHGLFDISKRLKHWRLALSFRPLKYENYIFPEELVELGPYLDATDAKVAAGEELIPKEDI